jgi:hypothetical protein
VIWFFGVFWHDDLMMFIQPTLWDTDRPDGKIPFKMHGGYKPGARVVTLCRKREIHVVGNGSKFSHMESSRGRSYQTRRAAQTSPYKSFKRGKRFASLGPPIAGLLFTNLVGMGDVVFPARRDW